MIARSSLASASCSLRLMSLLRVADSVQGIITLSTDCYKFVFRINEVLLSTEDAGELKPAGTPKNPILGIVCWEFEVICPLLFWFSASGNYKRSLNPRERMHIHSDGLRFMTSRRAAGACLVYQIFDCIRESCHATIRAFTPRLGSVAKH